MILTDHQRTVLEYMNKGMYLFTHEGTEYLSFTAKNKTSTVTHGTAQVLKEEGYIYHMDSPIRKYLLTDKGRAFKIIK